MLMTLKNPKTNEEEDYTILRNQDARRYLGMPGVFSCNSEKARAMFGPGAVAVPTVYLSNQEPEPDMDWVMSHS